jgi:hypothetical protein
VLFAVALRQRVAAERNSEQTECLFRAHFGSAVPATPRQLSDEDRNRPAHYRLRSFQFGRTSAPTRTGFSNHIHCSCGGIYGMFEFVEQGLRERGRDWVGAVVELKAPPSFASILLRMHSVQSATVLSYRSVVTRCTLTRAYVSTLAAGASLSRHRNRSPLSDRLSLGGGKSEPSGRAARRLCRHPRQQTRLTSARSAKPKSVRWS